MLEHAPGVTVSLRPRSSVVDDGRATQFIKAKNQELTEPVVRAATAGMKEADMAFTTVLNNLFAPMSKRRVKELGLREDEEFRFVSRLSREVEASGAIDKVYNGTPLSPLFQMWLTVAQGASSIT